MSADKEVRNGKNGIKNDTYRTPELLNGDKMMLVA